MFGEYDFPRGSFTTVIFQQMSGKPTKLKRQFAIVLGEVYPVRLCLHILPDVLWHDDSRLLVGPSRQCLGAFGFYSNVFRQAGFRSFSLAVSLSDASDLSDKSDKDLGIIRS